MPEFKETRQALENKYDVFAVFRIVPMDSYAQVDFSAWKYFDGRQEMLDYAKGLGVEVPTECNKSGSIDSDGKLTTTVMYTIELDDIELMLMYTRDGLPTDKCKVEETVTRQVVCNLD